MFDSWMDLVWLLNRFFHIVAATLLVGGTLFYALLVPRGIDDLKDSAQLAVMARLRWVFRWLVYLSVIALIISGAASWRRNWETYTGLEAKTLTMLAEDGGQTLNLQRPSMNSGLWFHVHTVLAVLALGSAIAIIRPHSPPNHPVGWLRVSLVLLLLATLAASMTRHSRLRMFEEVRKIESARLPLQPTEPE